MMMGILNGGQLTRYAGQVILLSQGAGEIRKARIPSAEAEAFARSPGWPVVF
jgi:hypothetical protein